MRFTKNRGTNSSETPGGKGSGTRSCSDWPDLQPRKLSRAAVTRFCRLSACGCLMALLVSEAMRQVTAQAPESQRTLELGIIVVPTRPDIDQVVRALQAGRDFSVLAKERSIDATAVDGGYVGRVTPEQLRTELRRAVEGRQAGELSDVVELPTGFAVLKIFPSAPPLSDLNPKRISSLIATGAIRYGAPLSGQVEANAIMQQFPKSDGWNRDLQQVCSLRKQSLA